MFCFLYLLVGLVTSCSWSLSFMTEGLSPTPSLTPLNSANIYWWTMPWSLLGTEYLSEGAWARLPTWESWHQVENLLNLCKLLNLIILFSCKMEIM
jgi:hypothetical protein